MTHYDIIALDTIADDPNALPAVGGLYGIALIDVRVLTPPLHRAGLALDSLGLGRLPFMYVAAATCMRSDVARHLINHSAGSVLRQSLGALLRDDLDLAVHGAGLLLSFDPASETRLTGWMIRNLVVVTKETVQPDRTERRGRVDIYADADGYPVMGRRTYDTPWSRLLVCKQPRQTRHDAGPALNGPAA